MTKRITIGCPVFWRGGEENLSFLPLLARRRLSLLQKGFYSLTAAAAGVASPEDGAKFRRKVVMSSCYGEYALGHALVETYNEMGEVSPAKFSASVFNAAPGLASVAWRNRAAYTAIASERYPVEAGLLAAALETRERLFAYIEETDGGHGIAFTVDDDCCDGMKLEIESGDFAKVAIDDKTLYDFLVGSEKELTGEILKIRKI